MGCMSFGDPRLMYVTKPSGHAEGAALLLARSIGPAVAPVAATSGSQSRRPRSVAETFMRNSRSRARPSMAMDI